MSMVAASLVLAAGLWSAQSLMSEPTAYAYVTVDINPSIELSIDEHKNVVQSSALNAEGETVLQSLQLKGLPVDDAVETLANAAKNQGYLNDHTEVIITASPAVKPEKLADLDLDQMEQDLVSTVQTLATESGTEVEVEGVTVSEDVRQAAKQAGVSPGKYALYLSAHSNGIDVDLDELKTKPLTQIVEARGTALADILHQIKGGKDLDGLLDTVKQKGIEGLHKTNKPAVLPNQKGEDTEPNTEHQPPGQAKKDDKTNPGQGKGHDKSNGNGKGNDKTTGVFNNTGTRQSNDTSNPTHGTSHQDDTDSDKAQHGNGNSHGKGNGNGNGNNKNADKHDTKSNNGHNNQGNGKSNNGNGNNKQENKKTEATVTTESHGFFSWLFGH
ncbi:MAG TPA: hypothetical protein VFV52_10710, partial [Bacilli bacterium]|nr:hypothetical protein [Bacilli bacterium]